jgi:hypothetical protein
MTQKVTQTVLDEGVRFKIHVSSPEILRWIGIRSIPLRMKNLNRGTLLKISPMILQLKIEFKKDSMLNAAIVGMGENMNLQSRIVAIAILNRPWRIKLFTRPLAWFLTWNLDNKSMSQLMSVLIDKMQVQDFMTSIVLTGGLQIQRSQTSLESDTGEKIAPGFQSGI